MVGGPAMAPAAGSATAGQEEMRWRKLDSGVSAVSFGFVATAILVSMFLAVAILGHFSAPRGWAALGRRPHSPEEEGSSYASSAAAPAPVRPAAPARILRRPGNSTAARPLRCLFMPKVSQFRCQDTMYQHSSRILPQHPAPRRGSDGHRISPLF